jgi:hypothetical protein
MYGTNYGAPFEYESSPTRTLGFIGAQIYARTKLTADGSLGRDYAIQIHEEIDPEVTDIAPYYRFNPAEPASLAPVLISDFQVGLALADALSSAIVALETIGARLLGGLFENLGDLATERTFVLRLSVFLDKSGAIFNPQDVRAAVRIELATNGAWLFRNWGRDQNGIELAKPTWWQHIPDADRAQTSRWSKTFDEVDARFGEELEVLAFELRKSLLRALAL